MYMYKGKELTAEELPPQVLVLIGNIQVLNDRKNAVTNELVEIQTGITNIENACARLVEADQVKKNPPPGATSATGGKSARKGAGKGPKKDAPTPAEPKG